MTSNNIVAAGDTDITHEAGAGETRAREAEALGNIADLALSAYGAGACNTTPFIQMLQKAYMFAYKRNGNEGVAYHKDFAPYRMFLRVLCDIADVAPHSMLQQALQNLGADTCSPINRDIAFCKELVAEGLAAKL